MIVKIIFNEREETDLNIPESAEIRIVDNEIIFMNETQSGCFKHQQRLEGIKRIEIDAEKFMIMLRQGQ